MECASSVKRTTTVVYKKRVISTFFTFSHIFHIFPHFSSLPVHFPNSCHKLHCSKEKVRLPQDTFDGHFNFEPETISFRKFEQGSTSKYFPKAAVTSKYFPKAVFT